MDIKQANSAFIADIMVQLGWAKSKSQARKMIENGEVSVGPYKPKEKEEKECD